MFVLGIDRACLNKNFYKPFNTVIFSFRVSDAGRPLLLKKLSGCHVFESEHGMKSEHDASKQDSGHAWENEEDNTHGINCKPFS